MNINDLYREWAGHDHALDIERNIYDSTQMQDFAGYCIAELRSELAEYESLIKLQRQRSVEADKLWQKAHNKPNVWPDLGKLLEWLIQKAFKEVRCCRNCKHYFTATTCSGCAYSMKDPATGVDKWEVKL